MTSENTFKNECKRLHDLFFGEKKHYDCYYAGGEINENSTEKDRYLYHDGATEKEQWCTFQIKTSEPNATECNQFFQNFYGRNNNYIKYSNNGRYYENNNIKYSNNVKVHPNFTICTFYMNAYIEKTIYPWVYI